MHYKNQIIKLILILLTSLTTSSCGYNLSNGNYRITEYRPDDIFRDIYKEISINQDIINREIDSLIQMFEKYYAHRDRKNIDFSELKIKYKALVQGVINQDDYKKLLMELFSELNNSHSRFVNPNPRKVYYNVLVTMVDSKVYVAKTASKKFNVGDEILAIDGLSVQRWLFQRGKINGSSTKHHKKLKSLENIFMVFGFEKNKRVYKVKNAKGQVKNIAVNFVSNKKISNKPFNDKVHFESKDDIGYLAINTMSNGVVKAFVKTIPDLLKHDKIILDLRFNGGGNSANGEKILSYFIDTPVTASVSRKSISLKGKNYLSDKDIIILIGNYTFSSAESFAIDLHSTGKYLFVGDITAGDTGFRSTLFRTTNNVIFKLPTRDKNFYSPHNIEMEGVGLSPDITVKQTLEDLNLRTDTVLEYAISQIKKKN